MRKFEQNGYTIEQSFSLFDDNGDGILTIKEIKDGFRDLELKDVLDDEIQALIKAVD